MLDRIAALALTAALVFACGRTAPGTGEEGQGDYLLSHRVWVQPVDHDAPEGPTLEQHVDLLVPAGAPRDAPVFFNLGNEQALTPEELVEIHAAFGAPDDVIFVQAEHRGYGRSITADRDQSVPDYVRIDQVLADAHRVIQELRKSYPGPWMVAGWSYGGGLVLEFAARYPEDASVILSSSGVVDWPFVMDAYDRQVRATLGGPCYRRLASHVERLAPAARFDEAWLEREFLIAIVHGVVQIGDLEWLQPYFALLSHLPTGMFLRALHRMDDWVGDGEAQRYAQGNARDALTREEAMTGAYGWRVWRYQQCAETGVFEVSADPGGLLTRTAEDYAEECRSVFGEEPAAAAAPPWSPREHVDALRVPLVYVSGGQDPWAGLGLQPDYPIPNGTHFHEQEGRHCPERSNPDLARRVLSEMLRLASAGF